MAFECGRRGYQYPRVMRAVRDIMLHANDPDVVTESDWPRRWLALNLDLLNLTRFPVPEKYVQAMHTSDPDTGTKK